MNNMMFRAKCGLVPVLLSLTLVLLSCRAQESQMTNRFPSAIWEGKTIVFTDPALGIVIEVPSQWSVYARTEGASESNLRDRLQSPCHTGAPDVVPPCTAIELKLDRGPVSSIEDVQSAIDEAIVEYGDQMILEEQEISLNGLPALWLKLEDKSIGEYPMVQVRILTDNHVVVLNAYGELAPVEEIVSSIRPIEVKP